MKTTKNAVFCVAFVLFIFKNSFPVSAQVQGCKDPAAINFNPAVTVADSTCVYNPVSYTPTAKFSLPATLGETSGLQWAGDALWTFNDGGGAAAIYRVDTSTGAVLQTVNLEGATNVDWEDIGFDGTHFYVGDIGNNFGGRTDLKIYKFPLASIPSPPGNTTFTIPSSDIKIINFSYIDQIPVVSSAEENKTKYDCEAMIVDGSKIHLFTKNWIDNSTTHYVINSIEAGSYSASPAETLFTEYLVTGADKAPGSNVAVLVGYENGGLYTHHMHVLSDFSGGLFFTGNRRKLNLPFVFTMGQAEGITFVDKTRGFISSEAVPPLSIPQKLFSFIANPFVPLYVLPVDLINFNVSQSRDNHTLNWQFAVTVKNLQVLRSTDGVNFTPVRSYASSKTDLLSMQAISSQACYKLEWQQANGTLKYSPTICVNDKKQMGLTNLVLKPNGEMLLTLTGDKKEKYKFNVVQIDGKQLAQIESLLLPGTNSIKFQQVFNKGSVVMLQAVNSKEQKSLLLRVE